MTGLELLLWIAGVIVAALVVGLGLAWISEDPPHDHPEPWERPGWPRVVGREPLDRSDEPRP